jgi:hypothetical protein
MGYDFFSAEKGLPYPLFLKRSPASNPQYSWPEELKAFKRIAIYVFERRHLLQIEGSSAKVTCVDEIPFSSLQKGYRRPFSRKLVRRERGCGRRFLGGGRGYGIRFL